MSQGLAKTQGATDIIPTGVSRQLGLVLAAGFLEKGHTVFGTARAEKRQANLPRWWPAPHGKMRAAGRPLRCVRG